MRPRSDDVGAALREAGAAIGDRQAIMLAVEDGGYGMAEAAATTLGLSAAIVAFEPARWHGLVIGIVGNCHAAVRHERLLAALGVPRIEADLAMDDARRRLRARAGAAGVTSIGDGLRGRAVLVATDRSLAPERVRRLHELLRANDPSWLGIIEGVVVAEEAVACRAQVSDRFDGAWAVAATRASQASEYAHAV